MGSPASPLNADTLADAQNDTLSDAEQELHEEAQEMIDVIRETCPPGTQRQLALYHLSKAFKHALAAHSESSRTNDLDRV